MATATETALSGHLWSRRPLERTTPISEVK
jgi:hypothetical protein